MHAAAIESVRHAHSYEERVIYITESFATRADMKNDALNPNRSFNRSQCDEGR